MSWENVTGAGEAARRDRARSGDKAKKWTSFIEMGSLVKNTEY